MTRSFFKTFWKIANVQSENALYFKTLLYWVASLKTLLREKRVPPSNCFIRDIVI